MRRAGALVAALLVAAAAVRPGARTVHGVSAPYVSGAIAFIWDDRSRGIGALRVLDGLGGLTRGFGTTGR